MPLFSVIIPTFNRYPKVRHAVESVLAQDFNDFQLILVDDGSTDDTPLLEEEFRGRLRYIRQENSGVSSARNRGIAAGSSRYVTFLDSDDRWDRGKLSAHRDYIDANRDILLHQTEEIWIRKGKRVNPRHRHRKKAGDIFRESLDLCLISPSTVCMDTELFDRYGLFDEKMPACEDYDLWLRITSRRQVGLIGDFHVTRYGGHEDQLSSRYWGMDRFRVYSLLKLLEEQGGNLSHLHETAVINVLKQKSNILHEGAVKRSNRDLAGIMREIIEAVNRKDYRRKYAQSLLTL